MQAAHVRLKHKNASAKAASKKKRIPFTSQKVM